MAMPILPGTEQTKRAVDVNEHIANRLVRQVSEFLGSVAFAGEHAEQAPAYRLEVLVRVAASIIAAADNTEQLWEVSREVLDFHVIRALKREDGGGAKPDGKPSKDGVKQKLHFLNNLDLDSNVTFTD
jgi:hypothetical protein